ncbi:hypothetical protein LSH36_10g01024 [Paralvinella palmiformis]|uniref:Choline O-acetyltransferase n=1 Tax=Paralvinella palmiformis TaxID=53620 RepID=A0AAD9NGN8_9ANNE|nr:hypothetical protein LSH36_10g01024 [Paralvinella palmiformis]
MIYVCLIDHQKPLPRLPVPTLDETLKKYLHSIKAVVSAEQYKRTNRLVEEFGKPDGLGTKLHEELLKFARTKDNWVYNLWLEDMYLLNKLPLPINSNPGMVLPRMSFEDSSEQLRFAARLLSAVLDYKVIIDSHALPIDRARSREKGQPLCMEQYYRLFNSYRLPGIEKDTLVVSSSESLSPQPQHIIVAYRNQFFVLDVVVNNTRLSNDNMYAQLRRIVRSVEECEEPEEPVGILTAARRDRWARARGTLMEEDSVNRDSLDLIERCIFILCLDEMVPASKNHHVPTQTSNIRDDTSMAKQMLHGHGSKYNTCNRWFDKTMQFVIGEDGSCGLCYEHSPAEGIAVTQLIEHLLKYMEEVKKRKLERMQSMCDLPYPKKLRWKVNQDLKREILTIQSETDRMIANTDLYVLRYDKYGKNFPKQINMSPDAYMQLALQLTYYRIHNCLVSTYESASIRRFRAGRVDNIRACTEEALNWAKAMTAGNQLSADEKMTLLRNAIKKQTEILVQTILGYGIDNHLLGLRQMAVELGIEKPEIFKDESYNRANHFTLSTSQVPSSLDTLTCYGPVVPDGYGACYNLQPDFIVVCVSSFLSCGATKSEVFGRQLAMTLDEMHDLCMRIGNSSDQTAGVRGDSAIQTKAKALGKTHTADISSQLLTSTHRQKVVT